MGDNLHFNINFVVAHKLEAKPLIRHFNLQAYTEKPYLIFKNENGIRLIICGMGASNANNAVRYMSELRSNRFGYSEGWINVGIAGHRDLELGTCFLVNKISSKKSEEVYYPSLSIEAKNTEGLITVDRPEKLYAEDEAYDMEAAGFFKAASMCSELELINTIKVISDNKASSIDNITEKLIDDLMLRTLSVINPVVSELEKRLAILNQVLVLENNFLELVKSIHFSVSQRSQLKRLFQRFDAMGRKNELSRILNCNLVSADQLLLKLSDELKRKVQ